MSTLRYKPSKPAAIITLVVGIGMLVFGLTQFSDADGGGRGFLVLWCVALVAIIGLNLWAAFAKRGSVADIVSDDDEPRR